MVSYITWAYLCIPCCVLRNTAFSTPHQGAKNRGENEKGIYKDNKEDGEVKIILTVDMIYRVE